MLFHEAMEEFATTELEVSFIRFERAAAKGHAESIWITSVVKDAEMDWDSWRKAFAKTEVPLGWYFAGTLTDDGEDALEFYKKSAEGGCSWGQVDYAEGFREGAYMDQDLEVYVEWLEKAADQNNPMAMEALAEWFEQGGQDEKAMFYRQGAAKLGWKRSMMFLSDMLREGEGCEKDLRQASMWSSRRIDVWRFRKEVEVARRSYKKAATADLGCDFNQLCYSLGWGLFWYIYSDERWKRQSVENKAFGTSCLDYYCSCVELRQKSIFSLLLCWQESVGVKDVGLMVAKMVWEGREENLLKSFELK
jgi:hypothetical protein